MRKLFASKLLLISAVCLSLFGMSSCGVNHKSSDDNKVYSPKEVDEESHFVGGNDEAMKYLTDNINYPSDAAKEGIQGRVIVKFHIKKDGSPTKVKVLRGVFPSLDEEAVRVIKEMPKWVPAKKDGKVVQQYVVFPISFRLF